MPLVPLLVGFTLSLVLAMALIPLVRRMSLRWGWVDAPDGWRKLHREAVPNVGGLGIAAAFFGGLGALWLARTLGLFGGALAHETLFPLPPLVLLGAAAMAVAGFVDDLRELHFREKFAVQIVAAGLMIAAGYRIELFDGLLGDGGLAYGVSVALTLVWTVGIMTGVNYLDGLDGLAAGTTALAFVGLAGAGIVGGDAGSLVSVAVVLGALVGFLRFNYFAGRASIFMGDCGSLFLGYLLAAYALTGPSHGHPLLRYAVPAVAMGLFVLDVATTITRRRIAGRPLFPADCDHIHHRLAETLTKRRATLVLYGVGALFAGGAVAMAATGLRGSLVVFAVGTGLVLAFLVYLGHLPAPDALGGGRRAWVARRILRDKALAGASTNGNGRIEGAAAAAQGPLGGDGATGEPVLGGPPKG